VSATHRERYARGESYAREERAALLPPFPDCV
jgi:hypothetical protein